MAELHILGQLQGVYQVQDSSSLFCRFSLQSGPNWTVVSGCCEGQTASGKPDFKNCVVWAHPIDIHYVTTGIQGWPKLVLELSCLDTLGRSWVVGYSCCSLPAEPGHHNITVACWAPAASTLTDKVRQYFLGGSNQLIQTDIINLGKDRFKLNTQSKGNIQVQIDLVLRNFSQFGVEYK
ncbi:B9 domain-containing protein 2-like isoform X3 [Pectinophora gossypiella]|uniref:B9 domain-containing protein 2-like isoform X3 n=1 Tax=Pectinophora gossypiella TaxID=13191 RepID=UPI00214EA992|nr:B9 domain-containing protein 2-like isoform X3 [Pectinophora gossypiella]